MKLETENLMSELTHELSKEDVNEEKLLIKFLESLLNEQNPTPTGGQ